jgi:hypothetical protein
VEVDAFLLPDTAGVSYRLAHTKTTIGIESIDTEAHTLGYFHNAGYFTLSGDDFSALFGIGRERRPDELVPYTEFAKFTRGEPLPTAELVARSVALLRRHLARRPRENPVLRFRERFEKDLAWLATEPAEMFHLYAFSSLRQCGAAFELAASYVRWLGAHGEDGIAAAADAFETLGTQAKTVQFKAARAVMLKRPVDFSSMLGAMQSAWDTGMGVLDAKYLASPAP